MGNIGEFIQRMSTIEPNPTIIIGDSRKMNEINDRVGVPFLPLLG